MKRCDLETGSEDDGIMAKAISRLGNRFINVKLCGLVDSFPLRSSSEQAEILCRLVSHAYSERDQIPDIDIVVYLLDPESDDVVVGSGARDVFAELLPDELKIVSRWLIQIADLPGGVFCEDDAKRIAAYLDDKHISGTPSPPD